MKRLSIVEVKNGWIMTRCTSSEAICDDDQMVFRDIKELQDKLPEILGVNAKSQAEGFGAANNPMYEAFKEGPKNL